MKKIILFINLLFVLTTVSQNSKSEKTSNQTSREQLNTGIETDLNPYDNTLIDFEPIDPVDPVVLPTEVGRTRGELSVSLTGAATYNIPIQVPPGINGIEPKLSLSYNSQGGVGLAGYGWNISGLSSITRIPATKFHDGFNDPVDLDSNDRFALDGQRLILETGTYGQAGATYVTENHSNVKIMSFPISGNPTRFYFKVLYPDGSYAIYDAENGGYNSNYRINTWINPQGLKINYTYTNNSNNLVYIASIKYGMLDSSASINEVQFIYKTRIYPDQFFLGGSEFINDKILSEIKILGNSKGYKSYMLTHTNDLGCEKLIKIQEKSGDGLKLLEPISFSYSQSSINLGFIDEKDYSFSNNTSTIGDFDGDGILDNINISGKNVFFNKSFNKQSQLNPTPILSLNLYDNKIFLSNHLDANLSNGQKKTANNGFCILSIDNNEKKYYFNLYSKNANGNFELDATREINIDHQLNGNSLNWYYLKNGDFNGDGLTDIILIDNNELRLINLDTRLINNYTTTLTSNIPTTKLKLDFKMGDVNGDGKTDLIYVMDNVISVFTLNETNSNLIKLFDFDTSKLALNQKTVLEGDYNGDGKTDFWFTNSRKILYSTGNGGFKVEADKVQIPDDKNIKTLIKDLNNDGKSDLVVVTKIYKYLGKTLEHGCKPNYPNQEPYNHTIDKCPYKLYITRNQISTKVQTYINTRNSWITGTPYTSTGSTDIELTSSSWPEGSVSGFISCVPICIETNQDSTQNLLYIASSKDKVKVFSIGNNSGSEKLLKEIVNGNVTNTITYTNLNDTSTYTKAGQIEDYPNNDILATGGFKIVSKIYEYSQVSYKTQDFKYYGATSNGEGLGFLGFRSILKTNWYNDPSKIISTITKFDINKRGAQTESFSVLGAASPNMTLSSGTPFISSTRTIYNNEDTVYENPLLPNKVFKLKATKIIHTNGLEGTSTEKTFTYNTSNSPTEITTIYKNGSVTEKTETQTLNYDATTTPYMVDRLTQKNYTATIYPSGDTTSSEEVYSYDTNLLTQIKKKGDGTDYITEDNQYDTFGNIIKKTLSASNMQSRTSSFEYDLSGRFLTKKTDIDGLITNYTYDLSKGLLLTESLPSTTASNFKNTYTYDTWGKLITKTNVYGIKETYAYANTYDGGFTKTTTNEDGGFAKVTYDVLGREIQIENKDLNGNSTFVDKGYDLNDRLTTITQPNDGNQGVWNETQYDNYGRVLQTTSLKSASSPGKITTYTYAGTTVTENDGVKSKTTTRNSLGQTVSVTETPGGTINYSYFANGNLKSTICNGATITIVQDGWGRKKELIDPSAGNRKYDYNAFGELTKEEVVGKGVTLYDLDPVGKLLSKTIKDISNNDVSKSTYSYNANKLVEKIRFDDYTNSTFTTNNYTYDSYYNVLSTVEELNGKAKFSTTFTYDAFGRPVTESYTSQNMSTYKSSTRTITNTYTNGYKSKITDNVSGIAIWETKTVNPQGQVLTANLGNGIAITNTYDLYGFPTQNKHDKANTNVMTLNNTFDPIRGNLLTRSTNLFGSWNETLTYDLADRLTTYKNAQGVQKQNYNENGTIESNSIGDYAYTIAGKPYQVSSVTPVDQSATSPILNYYNPKIQDVTYTVFKSPLSIKVESNEYIDFDYNTNNNRSVMYYGSLDMDKKARPYQKYYAANGVMEMKLKTTTPTSQEFLTYIGGDAYTAPAVLLSDDTTQKMYYLHRDYQGTIVAITNDVGVIVEKRLFDVWGEMIYYQNGAVTTIPTATGSMFIDRGYTGHEHLLGVDIINMNGRIYDHKFHRFLQPDNNIQEPSNTQNYNRYAYVMNNPTKYTDPSGEVFWGWFAGFVLSTYIHGAQATGNPNPTEWNAGQWAGAVSSSISPTVFNYVSSAATDVVNGYIINYGQPSAAQMEYMNNNPIVNPVEYHTFVSNNNDYLNQDAFAYGMKAQRSTWEKQKDTWFYEKQYFSAEAGLRVGTYIDLEIKKIIGIRIGEYQEINYKTEYHDYKTSTITTKDHFFEIAGSYGPYSVSVKYNIGKHRFESFSATAGGTFEISKNDYNEYEVFLGGDLGASAGFGVGGFGGIKGGWKTQFKL